MHSVTTSTLDLPLEFQELLDDFRMVPVRQTPTNIQIFHVGPYSLHVAETTEDAELEARNIAGLRGQVLVPEVVWQRGRLVLLTRLSGHTLDPSDGNPEALATQLGMALAQFHAADLSGIGLAPSTPGTRTPIHGQLTLESILWSHGEVSSFLDLDRIRLGDPYEDLAAAAHILSGAFQSDVREALFEGYGLSQFNEHRWQMAMSSLPRVALL